METGEQPLNQIAEINIDGMQCDACAQVVERVVSLLSGVETVSVDLEAARATITYDEVRVSISDLNGSIEGAGFDIRLG